MGRQGQSKHFALRGCQVCAAAPVNMCRDSLFIIINRLILL